MILITFLKCFYHGFNGDAFIFKEFISSNITNKPLRNTFKHDLYNFVQINKNRMTIYF